MSERAQKVYRFLESKGVSPNCPDCGANSWTSGHVVKLPIVQEFEPELEVPPYAEANALMYYKVCSNCGRVVFYSGLVLGLVGPDDFGF